MYAPELTTAHDYLHSNNCDLLESKCGGSLIVCLITVV